MADSDIEMEVAAGDPWAESPVACDPWAESPVAGEPWAETSAASEKWVDWSSWASPSSTWPGYTRWEVLKYFAKRTRPLAVHIRVNKLCIEKNPD